MTCSKRQSYPDRWTAEEMMQFTNRSKNLKRQNRSVYQCPDCGHWHMTSAHYSEYVPYPSEDNAP
jgi:hypothetical protein